MDESTRVGMWLMLLSIVSIFGLMYSAMTVNERMARAGFLPIHLAGDSQTYWIPVPQHKQSPIIGL